MANILTISIEASHIKIAEVSNSKSITVNRIIRMKTPEGCYEDGQIKDYKSIAKALEEKLTSKGINTKDVFFSVFSTRIAMKEILTPVLNEKKLGALIEANATEYYPVDINDYILAHKVLETVTVDGEKQMRVLLMAAPKDIIVPYYKIARVNGYNIKNIDYLGNSSMQLLRKHVDKSVNLVVQLLEESTIVNIIKNNVLQLQRVIPYGKSVLVDAVMETKGITEEEANDLLSTEQLVHGSFDGDTITNSLRYMLNNIARVVDYYASKNPDAQVEKAYYIGDHILGLDELLANEFAFPVKVIKKIKNVKPASAKLEATKMLGYIGCIGAVVDPANFVTKEKLEREQSERSFGMLRVLFYVAIAGSVALLAVPIVQFFTLQSEKNNLQKNIKELEDIEVLVNDYYQSKDIVTDASNFVALTSGNNDVLYEFIENLEAKQPSDISIRSINISDGVVSISAATSTKNTIAKFIMQLKEIPNVSSVAVSTIGETKDQYGVVYSTFSIMCTFHNDVSLEEFAGIKDKE